MSLLDDLVFYTKLDNTTPGGAIDEVSGNDLTENGGGGIGSEAGILNTARTFAPGYYFNHADAPVFSMGDIGMSGQVWVKLSTKAARQCFVVKGTGTDGEYYVEYNDVADRFQFTVCGASGFASLTVVTANNFGSPSTGVWYCIHYWHDEVGNVIGIAVNAGTPNTAAHTAGILDGAGDFYIGGYVPLSLDMIGPLDEVGLWKRVLTSQERTDLYASGAALSYDNFGGGGGLAAGTLTAAPTLTLDPPQPPGGLTTVASSNFTLTASEAVVGNTAVTLNETGAAGTNNPVSPTILSGQTQITFTRTPSATGLTTIRPSENGHTSSYQAVMSLATNTSGTPPYSNQLQRSPTGAGTWSNIGSPVVGSIAMFMDVSVVPGTTYDYRIVVTDDAAASVNSNTITIAIPDVTRYTSYSANRYLHTFVAPYGSAYTGEEATIGYTLYKADGTILLDHTTGQTNEVVAGTGHYATEVYLDENWIGLILWDAPSGAMQFAQAFGPEEPVGATQVFIADYGASHSGLEATLGYTAYDVDGNILIAHTTGNTNELPGNNGIYAAEITLVGTMGIIVWDNPTATEPISQVFIVGAAAGGGGVGLSRVFTGM